MELPEFLQNKSTDEIHTQMLDSMPSDIDKSQGQHPYNYTRPTAMIASELCQQTLPEIIKLIFPMYAYGEWLDYHAQMRGISRRPATASSGTLQLTVTKNTNIPEGSQFSTASVDGQPSVVFETTQGKFNLPEGTTEVPVKCTQTGTAGNVIAGTVIFKLSQLSGVTAVTNPEAITGGTEEEDDDSLRARIVSLDQSQSVSYVGSVADYKRWSLEVPGVGGVTVIPAQDDSGLVTLVITDSNGDPANEEICQNVYDYIMSPADPELRLTAPNVKLSVIPPTITELSISATVEVGTGSSLDAIKTAFIEAVQAYLDTARSDGEVRYTQIGKILAGIPGVYDYDALTLNSGTTNISITNTQLPQVTSDSVLLTQGVVT
ncbi:baseplate J/gp47 family protein [Agathobaculum sp. LCP25S3_E8]|uniref:baseplate J/gp47 family protein n=1 Tax=Agathobaculum sp. LCP25S3_E8 TaxID=3438735 RepID=UPI003F90D4A5